MVLTCVERMFRATPDPSVLPLRPGLPRHREDVRGDVACTYTTAYDRVNGWERGKDVISASDTSTCRSSPRLQQSGAPRGARGVGAAACNRVHNAEGVKVPMVTFDAPSSAP